MSRPFYLSSDSDDDVDNLPYPEPLARNAFLAPSFSATEFLSSLENRHQTLEDLRAELRTRSQELSKELLDLVNDNYEEFLGLGNDLRGGDEKVEEVRVGLLGFQREIDALREKTEIRRREAAEHLAERKSIVREIRVGNDLLEIDAQLDELEQALEITPREKADAHNQLPDLDLSDESRSESDGEESIIPLSRVTRRVRQYTDLQRLVRRVGAEHPFISNQEHRMKKVRQTLLMDLSNTLKQCRASRSQAKTLRVLKLFESVGHPKHVLAALREGKT